MVRRPYGEDAQLEREQDVVADHGGELEDLGVTGQRPELGERPVVQVPLHEELRRRSRDQRVLVLQGAEVTVPDIPQLLLREPERSRQGLVEVPLDLGVVVGRDDQDRDLAPSVRQDRAVPQGGAEPLEGFPDGRLEQERVERPLETAVLVDDTGRARLLGPWPLDDRVVELPLRVVELRRGQLATSPVLGDGPAPPTPVSFSVARSAPSPYGSPRGVAGHRTAS